MVSKSVGCEDRLAQGRKGNFDTGSLLFRVPKPLCPAERLICKFTSIAVEGHAFDKADSFEKVQVNRCGSELGRIQDVGANACTRLG